MSHFQKVAGRWPAKRNLLRPTDSLVEQAHGLASGSGPRHRRFPTRASKRVLAGILSVSSIIDNQVAPFAVGATPTHSRRTRPIIALPYLSDAVAMEGRLRAAAAAARTRLRDLQQALAEKLPQSEAFDKIAALGAALLRSRPGR